MKYDTAGNIIIELIPNCDCGLTCGCEKCNPQLFQNKKIPSIEEIWKITAKIPHRQWHNAFLEGRGEKCRCRVDKNGNLIKPNFKSKKKTNQKEEALAEKIKEIEGLRKKEEDNFPEVDRENNGFNQAISQVLSILKQKR